jgi:methyl coenzyme M reductase system, component A2
MFEAQQVPFIRVRNLTMDFQGERALDNISFDLSQGEILGIIGRSGSGKTVLMHLLRGIDQPPTSGSVVYHMAECPGCGHMDIPGNAGTPCSRCGDNYRTADIDLWNGSDEETRKKAMLRTAMMFQRTFALYGNDRVIENVLRALDDVEYPAEDAIQRAADLIDRVRLTHRMMHIARDLSGGEKQRVVLARQLAKDPVLLFADEPTGTLDSRTAHLVHAMLLDAARAHNMGMVITSHFSGVIQDVAHRAMLLDEGKIAKIGQPAEVIDYFMKNLSEEDIVVPSQHGDRIISARDLAKRYLTVDRGVIRAVHDVSFEVAEREIFGIIGTSGAGKTTLSRIMSGIIEPTSGEMNIRIGDDWVDMTKAGISERGRAKPYIGLLHQEYDLYPHRNVLDNLTDAIGLEFPKELALYKARISLKMSGFTDSTVESILKRQPGELSEGERHRVALAQVLIREPRIVVLDEPTGTMDPITKQDVRHSILHARNEMDETFVIISHDMEFVRDTCDRVALMRGGRIVDIGLTHDILEKLSAEEKKVMGPAETRGLSERS